MSRTWNLTDVELIVLWDDLFKDRLPAPLFAQYRGENAEDWARLAAEARGGIRARDDGALHDALARVAEAEVRVCVQAIDPRDPRVRDSPIRMLGGRRGAVAALIDQLPGETIWHSAGFVVSMGDADWLAAAVAGALPVREPGRLPDTPLVTDDSGTDHHYGRSPVRESYSEADRCSAAWMSRSADRVGVIEIHQGSSIFGPRGVTSYRIDWCDLAGDGRYAVIGTAPSIARAIDEKRLAAMITAEITKVMQTLEDERSG
ncbi:ESX secretion-associated protein EspG [Nocardia sp. NPDC005366]|uniref:ESX secretion-associated protein EspG n=1 Tax=Nocardia sp. NPDC005366 TaxID=3156878 RepID=UPI0033A190A2